MIILSLRIHETRALIATIRYKTSLKIIFLVRNIYENSVPSLCLSKGPMLGVQLRTKVNPVRWNGIYPISFHKEWIYFERDKPHWYYIYLHIHMTSRSVCVYTQVECEKSLFEQCFSTSLHYHDVYNSVKTTYRDIYVGFGRSSSYEVNVIQKWSCYGRAVRCAVHTCSSHTGEHI